MADDIRTAMHTPPFRALSRKGEKMKKSLVILLGPLFLAGISSILATSYCVARPIPGVDDKTAPSYDMKAQAALDLEQLQKKIVGLAEAIPADKYTWRPEPGVRSFSELFLHIAAANYNIPTMITGVAPAAGFEGKGFEKSTTDKAKIIEQLNKSFAYALAAVKSMSNADFAKPEKKLGPDANDGDVIYLLVTHAHEHMGQSIAYARTNGVTPPWTAEALKKNPKAPQE
jgi:uncharacterized damage-inducible protein DinB